MFQTEKFYRRIVNIKRAPSQDKLEGESTPVSVSGWYCVLQPVIRKKNKRETMLVWHTKDPPHNSTYSMWEKGFQVLELGKGWEKMKIQFNLLFWIVSVSSYALRKPSVTA